MDTDQSRVPTVGELDTTDPAWPPGTVQLEILKDDGGPHEVILLPKPTLNPNDPLNWPRWRKYLNFGLSSFYALMVFANISATTPTWGPMGDELHFSDETLNNTYAIGCATLAIGAAMLIPFALKYGLRPMYIFSSAAQFAVMIWAANTRTAGDWWGVNAVQCWLGSLAEVMVQMTVADVFFVHQRGIANNIYIWVAQTGSYIAPVCAGFITDSLGWRWVWWIIAILFALDLVLFVFLFEESKFNPYEMIRGRSSVAQASSSDENVAIDEEKKAGLQQAPTTASDADVPAEFRHRSLSVITIDPGIPRKTYLQRLAFSTPSHGPFEKFARHAYQPFMILFSIPGVFYMSLVYAVLLAWTVVMSAALSTYMIDPPYNFSATAIGLMNLPPFIGVTLGSLICGPLSDRLILKLSQRNNGVYEPEMRLWAFVPFIPFQAAGAWWFGYGLQGGQPWINVAVASAICAFGTAPLSAIALTYITDAYNEIVGDSLVGLTFLRNLFSTIFVFAMVPWVDAVGIANVFNTIGAIGLTVLLFSFVFLWKGKHWRFLMAKRYKYYAERQFEARPIKN